MAKQYFFITCLPRSGSCWLAHFLNINSISCLHDGYTGLTNPMGLKTKMDIMNGTHVGNCDPANLFFLDKLTFFFPFAKWIYIDRNEADAERSWKLKGGVGMHDFAQRAVKLLKNKKCFIIPYSEVFNRAEEIGKFIDPRWECPPWRKKWLPFVNIQQDFAKASVYDSSVIELTRQVEPIGVYT